MITITSNNKTRFSNVIMFGKLGGAGEAHREKVMAPAKEARLVE